MSAATIVAVAIWNALLLVVLAVAVTRRTKVLAWITRLDRHDHSAWESEDDAWNRFLAEHPELVDR